MNIPRSFNVLPEMTRAQQEHIHFICIPAVHIISFCVSFLSRVDELNKLACLRCMGLHSSAGRALQHERRGHGFESRLSPRKPFFGLFRNCLNYDSLRSSHIHFNFTKITIITNFRSFPTFRRRVQSWTYLPG